MTVLIIAALATGAHAFKVGTHFFYWYDAPYNNVDTSKMPFDPPGITSPYTYAPGESTYYSSKSNNWYKWQILDMHRAGIDYCLPVTWGTGGQASWFRQTLLTKLVTAIQETGSHIKIGMYDDTQSEACEWNYDNGRGYTNSRGNPDDPNYDNDPLRLSCADPDAITYFYDKKIKEFFTIVPRDLWATHNGLPVANGGRPLILTFTCYYYKDLYAANAMWDTIKDRFEADFGVRPWLVPCWSWWYFGNVQTEADGVCVYGAASGGIHTYTHNNYVVSNLGPGVDTRDIGGTDYKPRWQNVTGGDDQQNDQYYRENFQQVPWNVDYIMIESWNELWEGTAISRCTDFPDISGGNLDDDYYIEKTKELVKWVRDQNSLPYFYGSMEYCPDGVAYTWQPFWIDGNVSYARDSSVKKTGSYSQKVYTGWEPHIGGLYRQVYANPGYDYTFSVWTYRDDPWGNNGNINEETWVGIDPTGGVDPTSQNIVWSTSESSWHTWTQQTVSAISQSTRITLFMKNQAHYGGEMMAAYYDNATISSVATAKGSVAGNVTDELGQNVAGATVSCAGGAYSATTATDGSYTISDVPVGTYDVTAEKEYYVSNTIEDVEVTENNTTNVDIAIDAIEPDPVTSFNLTPGDAYIRLNWTNPASGNFEYTMIRSRTDTFPTSPTDGELLCDKAGTPLSTSVFIHAPLENGVTYYYTAFTHDGLGHYSTGVTASGSPVAGMTIMDVKTAPIGSQVQVVGIVTGDFANSGYIYIEDPHRICGIRVDTFQTSLDTGDLIDVSGTVQMMTAIGTEDAERYIAPQNISVITDVDPLGPVHMNCRDLGGGFLAPDNPGVIGGAGLNTIGLYVRTTGVVKSVSSGYFTIDDGSEIEGPFGLDGVMVMHSLSGLSLQVGDMVSVSGVLHGFRPGGASANYRTIYISSTSDVVVY